MFQILLILFNKYIRIDTIYSNKLQVRVTTVYVDLELNFKTLDFDS